METAVAAPSLAAAIAAADARLDDLSAGAPAVAAPVNAPTERLVLFSIGFMDYAVGDAFVTELDRLPRVTAVPRMPAWLRGVTNLRGDIVSVIDLRTFLGLDGPSPLDQRLIVVRLPDEEFAAGLVVDTVHRIAAVETDSIVMPADPFDGTVALYLRGVCEVSDRAIAVLDLDRLLRAADVRQFDDPRDIVRDKD